jgi:hypothetical protein
MKPLLFVLLFAPFFLLAQQNGQISGKVVDENGESLPYASVFVRNTTLGTATNAQGEFKLVLPRGQQNIVVNYIGYQQYTEAVEVGEKNKALRIQLQPSDLEIKEVVISSTDPAVRIMREAIAKRKYFRDKVSAYSADVYIKGFHKLIDTPKKILGQEVGDMDGAIDTSTRSGVLYLSESVSRVHVQREPYRQKEVMLSSKVSGAENGYSMNRSTLTNFDLYEEKIDFGRQILSPLADNAFSYYNFKFKGAYTDVFGFRINKIEVLPKRGNDPTYGGYVYIVDEQWNLSGVDLYLSGSAIKQPILDTIQVQQTYVPMELPDTWRLLSQNTVFKFGIFGFKIRGFFNGVFSNYDLHPSFGDRFFDKEEFKVSEKANEQSNDYWAEARPMPLTEEESRDYVKKDSLSAIRNAPAYLDSMDRRHNRFRIGNLLNGYDWQKSRKHANLDLPGAFKWVQFNTVQGLALNFAPSFEKRKDREGSQEWQLSGALNYGFSEDVWRGKVRFKRKFESIYYKTLDISGGTELAQFNGREPIGELINASYSLIYKKNYMKLYGRQFVRIGWNQFLAPGLLWNIEGSWNKRRAVQNNTDYSWSKSDREYSSNDPVSGQADFFGTHEALIFRTAIQFQPGVTYATYPKQRYYSQSSWPFFTLEYRGAFSGVAGADVRYDFVRIGLNKEDLSWGLAGYSNLNVSAGGFMNKKRMEFVDFQHFNGNLTALASPLGYMRSFYLLPYYAYSTDGTYVEAHFEHHLQGWLMDKLPLIRKLNLKEVFGAKMLWSERNSNDLAYTYQAGPYWEVFFGFTNLGFKPLRNIRVDVASSFFGGRYDRTGVVVGIGF